MLTLISLITLAPLFPQDHPAEKEHSKEKSKETDKEKPKDHAPEKENVHSKEKAKSHSTEGHESKNGNEHDAHGNEKHKVNAHNTQDKVEPPEFQERNKAAQYDYDEKLYGQSLENFQKILAEMGRNLTETQINKINLNMAHCYFELGQYYKATSLLDPYIGLDKLPLDFQNENFCSTQLSSEHLLEYLKMPPSKGIKSIVDLFPHLIASEEISKEFLVEAFNKILTSPDSCKKLIKSYINANEWKNNVIFEIQNIKSEQTQKLLARLILEALYPFNSYLNNKPLKEELKKDEHPKVIMKNEMFYQALYWRSRINLETNYYFYAKEGFEEILTTLNYRENERIISCLFYKAKSKFYLKQYKVALKELEDLNALYSLDEFYKTNFNDEAYLIFGRCYFELSKFDKAIQKFVTITAGYDNREPRNKLIRNAYYWSGEAYYCKGLLNEAIKAYEVILNYGTYSEKEPVYYSIGWALFDKGDRASRSSAKENFDLLLKNYPHTEYRLKAELKLAEIEIEEGHPERGEKIISELKNSTEKDTFLIKNNSLLKQTDFLIGLLYVKKKDYAKALVHFKRSEDTLDLNLKQKILVQSGVCYKELKDFKKAISYFTIASEMPANEAIKVVARTNIADTYFNRRTSLTDLESAAKIYDELINQDPNHD